MIASIISRAGFTWLRAPKRSEVQTQAPAQFPIVEGTNLERVDFTLPQDFAGDVNLVFIAFWQWQQAQVDTWLPLAQELEAAYPELVYYELPTLQGFSAPYRIFVNKGMRAGIPDPIARERTVTLYLDKAPFLSALAIPNQDHIQVLLVTRRGEILWRTTGSLTPEKADSLNTYLQSPVEVQL